MLALIRALTDPRVSSLPRAKFLSCPAWIEATPQRSHCRCAPMSACPSGKSAGWRRLESLYCRLDSPLHGCRVGFDPVSCPSVFINSAQVRTTIVVGACIAGWEMLSFIESALPRSLNALSCEQRQSAQSGGDVIVMDSGG
jgi:hypothetical protein